MDEQATAATVADSATRYRLAPVVRESVSVINVYVDRSGQSSRRRVSLSEMDREIVAVRERVARHRC